MEMPEVGDLVRVTKSVNGLSAKYLNKELKVIGLDYSNNIFQVVPGRGWVFPDDTWEPINDDTATKADSGKPPMDLLDTHWLEETAKVLGFGARKYARNQWRKGLAQSRLIAAALRHITAYNGGEDVDSESGLSHIAHASCCLMFLQNGIKERPELDDRHKRESPTPKLPDVCRHCPITVDGKFKGGNPGAPCTCSDEKETVCINCGHSGSWKEDAYGKNNVCSSVLCSCINEDHSK